MSEIIKISMTDGPFCGIERLEELKKEFKKINRRLTARPSEEETDYDITDACGLVRKARRA